jgi:deoxyribodipyrimidine photo-lyase
MRPEVWSRYRQELADLPRDAAFERAVAGETGIECFDFWARELCDTGYLHNHARMWFASIWIFTLRLPWQLGADFFLRHLLDGDPATNTLSWRWVGGLHTRGKHYLARASNIRKFTAGRFDPAGQLDETAEPLPPDHDFERESLVFPEPPPTGRLGHLMLADDLAALDCEAVQAVAGWYPEDAARLGSPSEKVVAFHRAALEERVAQRQGEILSGPLAEALRGWVEREALDGIVLTRPTVGPWRDLVREAAIDVPLYEWVHDWDRQLWPHATAGYFKLKKKLPPIFKELAQRARERAPTADS